MQPMDEVYQQYARTVYRCLLSLTRDADLAEELTQETFYIGEVRGKTENWARVTFYRGKEQLRKEVDEDE